MFKTSAPTKTEQVEAALELIRGGLKTESKVQKALGVTSTMARKIMDQLVEEGRIYRHARELHIFDPGFGPADYSQELHARLSRIMGPQGHTALSLKRQLSCSERELRATLEQMRIAGEIEGMRVQAIVIYRKMN